MEMLLGSSSLASSWAKPWGSSSLASSSDSPLDAPLLVTKSVERMASQSLVASWDMGSVSLLATRSDGARAPCWVRSLDPSTEILSARLKASQWETQLVHSTVRHSG